VELGALPGQHSRAALRPWFALEFDLVALGIVKINGRSLAIRSVTGAHIARSNTLSGQMGTDALAIEAVDAQAEVIHIAAILARRGSTSQAQLAVNRHQIDQGLPGAQLYQTNIIDPSLDHTTEYVAVKAQHRLQTDYPQDDMIEPADVDGFIIGLPGCHRLSPRAEKSM
jgi:hypothetical protein